MHAVRPLILCIRTRRYHVSDAVRFGVHVTLPPDRHVPYINRGGTFANVYECRGRGGQTCTVLWGVFVLVFVPYERFLTVRTT